MKMSVERWWNDTDRGNTKDWKKALSQCHFVHHQSHMDRSQIEPGAPR